MRLLDLSYPSAEENLAFEEWYFQHFKEETLRIWVSPTSVISGKHQNVLAECNLHACRTLNIPVLRRISGGGTVYHDHGNINFSFFRFVDRNKMIDYDRSLILIQEALQQLGFPVSMSERHDLFLNENKISGNAQHLRSGRVLHHGTILYDANLDHLRVAIKRTSGTFVDKGVKSVRSPIANLRGFRDLGSTIVFKNKLIQEIQHLGLNDLTGFSVASDKIATLANEKYRQDEWNFGYSPSYEFSNQSGDASCRLSAARGGEIQSIEVITNKQRDQDVEKVLLVKRHFYDEVKTELELSGMKDEKVKLYLDLLF